MSETLRGQENERRRKKIKRCLEDAKEAGEEVGELEDVLRPEEEKSEALDAFMGHVFAETTKLVESKITVKKTEVESKKGEMRQLEEEIAILEEENAVLRARRVQRIRDASKARQEAEDKFFEDAIGNIAHTLETDDDFLDGEWRNTIEDVNDMLSDSKACSVRIRQKMDQERRRDIT